MTARDLRWRASGVALLVAAGAIGLRPDTGGATASGLMAFILALAGAVLLIQGRHVPLALRVERGRHRHLPRAMRERHRLGAPERR